MKHRCSRRLVLALASGALFPLARADVTLPAIFSDHLVLQRDVPVPVWGWADAGETVTVSVAGQTQTATTGADGKWRVTLTKLASGEPGTLTRAIADGNLSQAREGTCAHDSRKMCVRAAWPVRCVCMCSSRVCRLQLCRPSRLLSAASTGSSTL